MRIIPAIDIIDGKCVRLTQGEYSNKKVYNENPVEVARNFEDHGIKYLHVVDLDGAKQGRVVNHKVLAQIAAQTKLHIDFGGGIKTTESIEIAYSSGAQQVTVGSIAANNKALCLSWLQQYGAEKLILGADAKDGYIATQGWTETSKLELGAFIKDYLTSGFTQVICTDIAKDGMLQGPATQLYKDLIAANRGIQLIASGGVSSVEDLEVLKATGVAGVIIGKALYEDRITLKQLQVWL